MHLFDWIIDHYFILKVLNLRNFFDIYEILTYPERFGIKSQLQELVDSVQVPNIEIHVDDAIGKLAQSGLKDFDIDKFTDNVSSISDEFKNYYFFPCIYFHSESDLFVY